MDTTLRPTGLALLLGAFVLTAGVAGTAGAAGPSKITPFERERGRMILNAIEDDLRKYYYDPAYHGLDVDRLFKSANESIDEAGSTSLLMNGDSQRIDALTQRGAAAHVSHDFAHPS